MRWIINWLHHHDVNSSKPDGLRVGQDTDDQVGLASESTPDTLEFSLMAACPII